MGRLDQLIIDKERECATLARASAELAHRLEVAQIELRTLKLAASVIAAPENSMQGNGLDAVLTGRAAEPPTRRGPKALWSLSEPYRKLVVAIVAKGNPLMNSNQISALAKTIGLDLAPKHASGRFRKYIISGMAERVGDQYRLTAPAVRAFGQNVAPAA